MDTMNLPDGWKIFSFAEVCEISGGSQPPKSTFIHEPKDGYIRLVQVRDYRTDNFITYIPEEKAKKFCNKTDIMIGRYGPPIFGIFRGLEGAYNVALMKAIPNTDLLDAEYLYWFLKTPNLIKFVEKSSKRAAGQDGVRKEVLYTYPVPVPPLTQQKQIVAILDKAFTAIDAAKANAEQNLKNAKQLFESYLQNVFENKGDDWEEKTLGEIVGIKTGKLNSNAMVEQGKYPFFTCSKKIFAINEYAFNCKAVLLAGNNASGDFNVKYYEGKFNAYQRTYVITINNEDEILYSYLKNKLTFHLSVFKKQSFGANTKFLKIGMIQGVKIILPPIKEQKQIVKKLDALSAETKKLEAQYTQKIADLDELKKSILQQAFSGKLTLSE